MKSSLYAILLWVLGTGSALAFLGVGDVTFDPPVHAELISLFNQTLAICRTAKDELRRMQAVQQILKNAQRDAKGIANGSLLRYETNTLPIGIPKGLSADLGAAQGLARSGLDVGWYYQQQVRRFHELERLHWLVRGTGEDVRLAATSIGEKTSGDVTAQATATLAALAAASARSAQRRAIRRAAERRNDRNLPVRALALYRAFGVSP